LVTFINQLRLSLSSEYETEPAVSFSSTEVVRFDGVYIRSEKVIPRNSVSVPAGAVFDYTVPDGGKVAADSVVANIYTSAAEIGINRRITELEEELKVLDEEQNPGTTAIAQPEFISSLISDAYQSVLTARSNDNLTELPALRTKLRTLMGIYKIVTKAENDYSTAIAQINSELALLKSQRRPPAASVTSGDSGYFISYTDGYELTLTPEDITSLTLDRLETIVATGNDRITYDAAIGKLVSDYKWQMAGIINPEEAHFTAGAPVELKIPEDDTSVIAVIEQILETDDPDKRILILSCSDFSTEFAKRRVCRAELILNDFTGLRIPRSAIRFTDNNIKGVYILQGQKISFKKIEPIFEADDYIISASPDSSYVSLYDDIITEGRVDAAAVTNTSEITEQTDV
jgi:hypothetical protein